ncbi:MAG: hypothetical protein ACT4P2_06780 [Pseudomonadota bacterium]
MSIFDSYDHATLAPVAAEPNGEDTSAVASALLSPSACDHEPIRAAMRAAERKGRRRRVELALSAGDFQRLRLLVELTGRNFQDILETAAAGYLDRSAYIAVH